jgi:hypothetical protein
LAIAAVLNGNSREEAAEIGDIVNRRLQFTNPFISSPTLRLRPDGARRYGGNKAEE